MLGWHLRPGGVLYGDGGGDDDDSDVDDDAQMTIKPIMRMLTVTIARLQLASSK